MLPLGQWLELSWARYKEKLWEQLVIGGLGGAAGLLAGLLPFLALAAFWLLAGAPHWPAWAAAGIISVSAVLWITGWAQAAMMESALAVEKVPSSKAYAAAWPKTAAFSWVCILWFLALAGGVFLFVLPAVALGVFLAFAPFAAVAEGSTGLSALERSFALVRGRWWAVLGRLLIVGAALAAAGAVPVAGFILSALAAPFALIAMAVLYEDLRRLAAAEPSDAGQARGWLLASAAGLAIMLLMGVLAARRLESLDMGTVTSSLQSLAQRSLAQSGVSLGQLTP